MSTTLPPLIIYPATRPFVVLRNSTFRKRFKLMIDDTPVDLTPNGTIIDADIKDITGTEIGTFTTTLPEESGTPIPGFFDLTLSATTALALPVATTHRWDVSITYPSGDRFYYCEGPLEVRETISRND
jgi:hypothetical protein